MSKRGISAWDQVLSSLALCSLVFTCTFLYPSVEAQCDLREDLANMVRNSQEYQKLVASGLTPRRYLSCEAAEHLSGVPKDWTCAKSTLCPQEIGIEPEVGLFDKNFVRSFCGSNLNVVTLSGNAQIAQARLYIVIHGGGWARTWLTPVRLQILGLYAVDDCLVKLAGI